jgi:hypothetical protein
VALFLEETGLAYEVVPIDVPQGEQFSAAFLELDPNAKIPVVVTESGETVFDARSGSPADSASDYRPAWLPGAGTPTPEIPLCAGPRGSDCR